MARWNVGSSCAARRKRGGGRGEVEPEEPVEPVGERLVGFQRGRSARDLPRAPTENLPGIQDGGQDPRDPLAERFDPRPRVGRVRRYGLDGVDEGVGVGIEDPGLELELLAHAVVAARHHDPGARDPGRFRGGHAAQRLPGREGLKQVRQRHYPPQTRTTHALGNPVRGQSAQRIERRVAGPVFHRQDHDPALHELRVGGLAQEQKPGDRRHHQQQRREPWAAAGRRRAPGTDLPRLRRARWLRPAVGRDGVRPGGR